jgi:integrase
MKFAKESVAKLVRPPGKSDHIEWDDSLPGFGVRLRGETKRYVAQYRVGLQQRRESLGDVRKVDLEDARKAARRLFAKAELGEDPAAERAQARAAAAASKLTLAAVAERYLDAKKERLGQSAFRQAKLHFTSHWKPLRNLPLEAVKRADIAARLQELIKNNGRVAAARARTNLRALFTWAMKEGLCEGNPVIATNNPEEGIPSRDRVLDDAEIHAIWRACDDTNFSRVVKLLLLTGCRRGEIGGLKWSEVDPEHGTLTIPGARTKNKKTLTLTLPPIAVDLIASTPKGEDSDFVFGRDGGPFSGWSGAKVWLDARIAMTAGKQLAPWCLHDLRRTMRTNLGKLGVAPHVAELAINHARGGVQAIYDRHRYEGEIAAALALWADRVAAVVEGRTRKIVPLYSAARPTLNSSATQITK